MSSPTSNRPSTAPSKLMVMEKSTAESKLKDAAGKTGDPLASGNQSPGEGRPKQRKISIKGKRKGKPGKIHIRLPSIEAYQKDLCFAAEAPGRVVVRLERLMGTDKIRPVDGKYMETLMHRLEEEEKVAWEKKIRLRKKAEKERHRQLAIAGLMEPGPGMEDLYNHPVFRVNRILNRLSSLDNSFSNNPANKFPPIVPIDPFETDETGEFFKEYPAHRALRKQWEMYKDKHPKWKNEKVPSNQAVQKQKQSLERDSSNKQVDSAKGTVFAKSEPSKMPKVSPPSDLEEEDEYDEELLEEEQEDKETALATDAVTEAPSKLTTAEKREPTEPSEMEQLTHDLNREYMESLEALQDKYEIPHYDGFEDEWKPYRSEMVDMFNAVDGVNDMYTAASHLFEVYVRQALVTQSHIKNNVVKSNPSKTNKMNAKQTEGPAESTVKNAAGKIPSEEEEAAISNQLLAIEKEAVSRMPIEEDEEGEESQMDDVPELVPAETDAEEVNDSGESKDVSAEKAEEEEGEGIEVPPVETDTEEEQE